MSRSESTPGGSLGFVDDRFDSRGGWGRDQLQCDPAEEANQGHGHRLWVGICSHRAVADPFADLVGEEPTEAGVMLGTVGAIFLGVSALVCLLLVRARRDDVTADGEENTLTELSEVI